MSGLGRLPLVLWCCLIELMYLDMQLAGDVVSGYCPWSPAIWDTYEFYVGNDTGPQISDRRKILIENPDFYLYLPGRDKIHRGKYRMVSTKMPRSACSVRLLIVEGPNQKEEYKNNSVIFLMEDFVGRSYDYCNRSLTAQNLTWEENCWPVLNSTTLMRRYISGKGMGKYGFTSIKWTAVLGFECCFDPLPQNKVDDPPVMQKMIELRRRFNLTKSEKCGVGVFDTKTGIDCKCFQCKDTIKDTAMIVLPVAIPSTPIKPCQLKPQPSCNDFAHNLNVSQEMLVNPESVHITNQPPHCYAFIAKQPVEAEAEWTRDKALNVCVTAGGRLAWLPTDCNLSLVLDKAGMAFPQLANTSMSVGIGLRKTAGGLEAWQCPGHPTKDEVKVYDPHKHNTQQFKVAQPLDQQQYAAVTAGPDGASTKWHKWSDNSVPVYLCEALLSVPPKTSTRPPTPRTPPPPTPSRDPHPPGPGMADGGKAGRTSSEDDASIDTSVIAVSVFCAVAVVALIGASVYAVVVRGKTSDTAASATSTTAQAQASLLPAAAVQVPLQDAAPVPQVAPNDCAAPVPQVAPNDCAAPAPEAPE